MESYQQVHLGITLTDITKRHQPRAIEIFAQCSCKRKYSRAPSLEDACCRFQISTPFAARSQLLPCERTTVVSSMRRSCKVPNPDMKILRGARVIPTGLLQVATKSVFFLRVLEALQSLEYQSKMSRNLPISSRRPLNSKLRS